MLSHYSPPKDSSSEKLETVNSTIINALIVHKKPLEVCAFHFVEIFHLVEITSLLHVIVMLEEKLLKTINL